MRPTPTDSDYREACARLGFPPNGWSIIAATAREVAAERALDEARKAKPVAFPATYTHRGKVGRA